MPAGISSSDARTNTLQASGCQSYPVNIVLADIAVQAPLETFDSRRGVDHGGLYSIFVSRIPSPVRRSRRSLQRSQKTISLPHGVPPYTHHASTSFPYQDRYLNQPTPLPYDPHVVWSSSGMFSVACRASDTFYTRTVCPGEGPCESCFPVRDR